MSESSATDYQECLETFAPQLDCAAKQRVKKKRTRKAMEDYPSIDAIRQKVLRVANKYRRLHNANSLELQDALNQHAQQWAEHLAEKNLLETRENPSCGESIMSVRKSLFCVPRLIKLWYQEKYKYDFTKPGFDLYTGHFTQLVWQSSKHLGVGISANKYRILLVCNFHPPGNIRGQYEQNVMPRQPLSSDTEAEPVKPDDVLTSAVTLKQ